MEDLCVVLARPMASVIFNFEKDDPTYKKAVEDLKKDNPTFQMSKDMLEARILELEELYDGYPND